MPEQLRFGIIGCGVIGPTHADAIVSLPDALLVAAADMDADRVRTFAARYGIAGYSSIEQFLAREDLDVVCVCTPSGMHGTHAQQAMRSGRHVIVEKPIEISAEALDAVLACQRECGVKLSGVFQHRWDQAAQQVSGLVREGAFGRLVLGSAHIPWWRSQQYYDSGAWRGTRALDGGGVLMNQGIHSIDLLQWLMGPVSHVRAYAATVAHQMECEDVAVAALRFANGALGTIAATTAAFPGLGASISIHGDRGSAVIADDQLASLQLARDTAEVGDYGAGARARRQTDGAGAASDPTAVPTSTHALQIADMIRAIREDSDPAVDGPAARRAVDIILAIYQSAATGQEVALP